MAIKKEIANAKFKQMVADFIGGQELVWRGNREEQEKIRGLIGDLKKDFEKRFVSKIEFEPVRNIAYGFVGVMLTGILVILLGRVI